MSTRSARLGRFVVLVWIALGLPLGGATTVIPTAFFFNTKISSRLSSQTSDRAPTQLYVATDPFASSMECWMPKQPRSIVGSQREQRNVVKHVTDEWLMEFWLNLATILQVSLETLLGILDVLSKNVVIPTWEEFQTRVQKQVASVEAMKAAVAVDPGDFLCEHSGWQAYFDRADTCLVYYFHCATGVSQWDPPFPDLPMPKLNSQQLALAKERYQDYHQSSFNQQSNSFMSQQEPLINSVLKGVQELLFHSQNPQKPSRKPDTDEDEDTPGKKPWWASMIDNLLESNSKATAITVQNPSTSNNVVTPSKSEEKALVTNDIMPFFAAFQDSKDATTAKEEIQIIEPPTDGTNALSPLWDMFLAVVKMASASQLPNNSTLAVASIESTVTPSESSPPQPWDFLFSFGKNSYASPKITTSKTSLKPEKNALTSIKDAEKDSIKVTSNWMADLPLFLTRDASRTIPLFGLLEKQVSLVFPKKETAATPNSSPSTKTTVVQKSDQDRLKLLEEKRYAASRARQANLRRAYGTVIHDRSPTVSLTSIKLNKKKNSNSPPDWYKYLDD